MITGTLPEPSLLLGHPKFSKWYPGQEYALRQVMGWMNSPERFLCASMPTGSGKSLLAVLSAHLSGSAVVFNTITKGLQAQLTRDFHQIGMTDIRGQNSYPCLETERDTCDQGYCHAGIHCKLKEEGCAYYDQVRRATDSPLTVTNYAYWLAQTNFSDGLGYRDLLVCDEAHLAFQALENYLTIQFTNAELQNSSIKPPSDMEIESWKSWARLRMGEAVEKAQGLKENMPPKPSSAQLRELRYWTQIVNKTSFLIRTQGTWISQSTRTGVKFTPVWPGLHYTEHIFHKVPKILIMSATLTEKHAASLGIKEGDFQFLESPSYFPPNRSPVFHVKTVRMNHRTSEMDFRTWMARIDQLISRRLDRKGIVFTVSYERRNQLMANSIHRDKMISHDRGNVFDQVAKFKESDPPSILVSPSITSGWDFPDTECEYVIVGKIPYPDTSDPVIQARQKDDQEWTSFLAMETLVQVAGRGTRSETDRCETIIIDDSWFWYWKRYQKFAPKFFRDRVLGRSFDTVPDPLF